MPADGKVDAYASLEHYADHIWPVWNALPDEVRGTFWSHRPAPGRTPLPGRSRDFGPDRLTIVAGFADARRMEPRPLVYVEHGAGQTYVGGRAADLGSYSGGPGHERVRLFLCPSETVAARWQARYDAPTAAVGVPKLDRWHRDNPDGDPLVGSLLAYFARPVEDVPRPRVAVTFHWQCRVVPETDSAWPYYDPALPSAAADDRWRLLGHGHPRLWGAIERRWRRLGVEPAPAFADVLDRADVLVGDNTSALYEFASTGRPVLVVNAPWFRRDVEHGLRFWSHVPGIQIDDPADLADGIAAAISDPPEAGRLRAAAVAEAYAHTDGRAAERAAEAIVEVLNGSR